MSVIVSGYHTKRIERSTDRNPSPIFTKLATKVESREMWLPIVLVEIRKTHARQTGSGINFHHCVYGKIAVMSNISKTVGSLEVEYETTPGLWIVIMTFNLGWPWTVTEPAHLS